MEVFVIWKVKRVEMESNVSFSALMRMLCFLQSAILA